MKLKQLFSQVRIGKGIQNAGNQIVVPLITDSPNLDLDENISVKIVSDNDYSFLTIENFGDKPTILPQGTAFITEQSAQDRVIKKGTIIEANKRKRLNVACIEQSQGGFMDVGTNESTFIPASLRSVAIDKADEENYDVLWNDIENYMDKAGIKEGGGHIKRFYETFGKELEEFIAPFEPVQKQVDAIILINNVVVGVELYPNYGAWRKVWRRLIRDSYGADAITLIKMNKAIGFKPNINVDNVVSIDNLKEQVAGVQADIVNFIKDKINPFLDKEVDGKKDETKAGFVNEDINVEDMKGQCIYKDDKPVYMTLVKKVI